SYWMYMEEGGFLEVLVDLKQQIKKGDKIAIVKNAFGKVIKEYFAPENGIIIGKSTNPANMNGGRIVHLGVF
ncbi:MAG: peptidase M14, partial [Polaribacter sp.]